MPETSIVIRTYNEEKHLENLLSAIKEQDYKDYEIIIVDSGSTDQTLEIAQQFTVQIIKIDSRDFTFGYALNIGCEMSRGKYLVFVSAHVLPTNKQWLSNLLAPFKDKQVAVVYGRQMGDNNSKFSEKRDFSRLFGISPINSVEAMKRVNNAHAAIRKELWEKRRFDEYLFGLEDIEWAKYIAGEGFLIHYEPRAVIFHLHNEAWYQVFNRYRREAIAAVRIGLDHPPQVKTNFFWLIERLIADNIYSFPNWFPTRLKEILWFRYYQWRGSRQGWFLGRNFDLNRDKQEIFSREANQVVLIRDKNKAKLTKIYLSEMKPGDILIKVDYVGICRTDLEIYEGSLGYYRNGMAHYPIVPGHEFSGTIIRIGANNKYRERFKIGERVVGRCILSRGECGERREVGVINHHGSYGKFVLIPGSHIHKIPNHLNQKIATLTEPLAVTIRAVRRIRNKLVKESNIAVIGAGTIGNFCTQILHHEGYRVSSFDRNSARLEYLKNKTQAIYSSVNSLEQFDFIIEATGSKEVLDEILAGSGMGSTILLLGFPYGNTVFNFENLVGQEKVIIGSVGAEAEDFIEALELLSELDTEPFTQKIMPLKDFKQAWRLHQTSQYLKIILQP